MVPGPIGATSAPSCKSRSGTMNRQDKTLDEELRKLALEAQRHPPRSRQRRAALTKLTNGILGSGRIARPYKYQFPEFYEDIRNEAIQKTTLHICDKIESYNPDRGPVIRWFNFFLERRFFPEAIPEIVGTPNVFLNEPAAMDRLASEENIAPLLSEELIKYIQEDPEGLLKKLTIQLYPQVSFLELIRRRTAGQKWKEIAADLDIKTSTLSSFYQRCLKEVAPQIKRYLES